MLRSAVDADVHGDIVRGLRRRMPTLDLVRVQDVLAKDTSDPEVLAWAASENRALLTHDRNTMVGFARQRVVDDEPMPGLIVTSNSQSIGSAIEDIQLITEYMTSEELAYQTVVFLPLR